VRSSTSNSDRAVWTIVAVAALIVAGYQLVVPRVIPDGGRGHDQWQENLIKAQRLIYRHVSPTTIVVGSSKLARVQFAPATNVYNLALNGGGSLTGLEIILRADVRPRVVVVEIGDSIVRDVDSAFLGSLFSPVNRRLRGWLPVLQDAYQPGVLINHAAQSWANSRALAQDDRVRPELLRQLVAAQAESHASPPDPFTMGRVTRALQGSIDALRARGIAVVFVEPPEDAELWSSPASTSIRRALHQAFPSGVTWYPDPDLATYHTTDAVHLDRSSADRLGAALTSWLATPTPGSR
jgi:hypothetical protein